MLDQVVITSREPGVMRELAVQFPSVSFTIGKAREPDVVVRARDWRAREFDIYGFDAALDCADARCDLSLHIIDDDPPLPAALEILNRCQRTIRRRNRRSETPRFDAVLAEHRSMHDLEKPLVRADYNHALDTWQWVLRLAPEASLPLQLAALFHDVERLRSEPDERIEHRVVDYQAFKDRHAAEGAAMASEALRRCGVDAATCGRTAQLIASHERRATGDAELLLLNDADALSFFSLNSTGFADYYGREHTRRKLLYTLSRLGEDARRHLSSIHLRDDVRELFASCAG